MKKARIYILISLTLLMLSACNSNDKNKNNISTIEAVNTETVTPKPTPIVTEEPTPSPTPKMTGEEKANLLATMGNKYIKNEDDGSVEKDEFDNSVTLTIPELTKANLITGDNSENILINSYILQTTSDDYTGSFRLTFFYKYDGELVSPTEVYFKTDSNKIVLDNLTSVKTDIGLGYVQEMFSYEFNNIEAISELKELLTEKVRVRLSGNVNIDFTLTDNIKQSLLDSIDLYLNFYDECN